MKWHSSSTVGPVLQRTVRVSMSGSTRDSSEKRLRVLTRGKRGTMPLASSSGGGGRDRELQQGEEKRGRGGDHPPLPWVCWGKGTGERERERYNTGRGGGGWIYTAEEEEGKPRRRFFLPSVHGRLKRREGRRGPRLEGGEGKSRGLSQLIALLLLLLLFRARRRRQSRCTLLGGGGGLCSSLGRSVGLTTAAESDQTSAAAADAAAENEAAGARPQSPPSLPLCVSRAEEEKEPLFSSPLVLPRPSLPRSSLSGLGLLLLLLPLCADPPPSLPPQSWKEWS